MPVRTLGGVLYLDFRFNDERFRPCLWLEATPENIKIAQEWDATIRREKRLGIFDPANHFPTYRRAAAKASTDPTFKKAAEAWLQSHKATWAEWTYRKFKNALNGKIFAYLGHLKLSEIDAKRLRLVRGTIIEGGRRDGRQFTNRTVNRIFQPVIAIFNELFGDGDIKVNPVANLGRLKEKRIAEIDPFSKAEIKVILKNAHESWPRYGPYIEFLFESGWRPNEVNGLKWDKVNMVTDIISVREGRVLGKNKDPKTKQAIRDIHMTPGIKRALKKEMAISYLKYAYVFVGDKGQPIDVSNFRARVWEPLLKKATVKYRYPYQCRHTFATSHIDERYSPLWIAKQLGTSVEMVFQHYAVYIEKAQLHGQSLTKYHPKPAISN